MPDAPQHYSMPTLDTTPPGSWRFLVKETGKWFRNYVALADLISALRKHYTANELPIPADLQQQIIDQMCPDLPAGWCEFAGHPTAESLLSRYLTFKDVLAGTKTLLSWQLQGRPRVSKQEAEGRAAVCVRCQYNVQPGGCPSCNSPLHQVVNAFVGGSKTNQDDNLRACKICGCSLKAKVWFPVDLIRENMPEGQQDLFPQWCWLARPAPQPTYLDCVGADACKVTTPTQQG